MASYVAASWRAPESSIFFRGFAALGLQSTAASDSTEACPRRFGEPVCFAQAEDSGQVLLRKLERSCVHAQQAALRCPALLVLQDFCLDTEATDSIHTFYSRCQILTSRELSASRSDGLAKWLKHLHRVTSPSWASVARVATHPVRQITRCCAALYTLHRNWSLQTMWLVFTPLATVTEHAFLLMDMVTSDV